MFINGPVSTTIVGGGEAILTLPASAVEYRDERSYDPAHLPVSADAPPPLDPAPDPASSHTPLEMQSTVQLLAHIRAGDPQAREVLFSRCVPALRRWTRGRLPSGARTMLQTEDIVQEAVFSVLQHLDTFESRHQGALQAYLRQTALNRIRDEARRLAKRPVQVDLDDQQADSGRSPLEQAINSDALDKYEGALARLSPLYREAIVARIEMQNSYVERTPHHGRERGPVRCAGGAGASHPDKSTAPLGQVHNRRDARQRGIRRRVPRLRPGSRSRRRAEAVQTQAGLEPRAARQGPAGGSHPRPGASRSRREGLRSRRARRPRRHLDGARPRPHARGRSHRAGTIERAGSGGSRTGSLPRAATSKRTTSCARRAAASC
jgi:RNA polymerase sigma factor (sigma-70 family)